MVQLKFSDEDRQWMHDAVDVMIQDDRSPNTASPYYDALMARLMAGGPALRDLSDVIAGLHFVLREGGLDEQHCADERPEAERLLTRLAGIWHPIAAFQNGGYNGIPVTWSGTVQATDGHATEAEVCDHQHATEAEADTCADNLAACRVYAGRVMEAIRADVTAGRVPAGVDDFGKLHDHVDANMYLIEIVSPDYAGDVDHAGDEDANGDPLSDEVQAIVDAENAMVNAVIEEVHARLQAGAAGGWCRTCGHPVGRGRCVCWCLLADALQRFLGMDHDGSADMAARLWDAEADRVRVWRNDYADDHDGVDDFPPPGGEG